MYATFTKTRKSKDLKIYFYFTAYAKIHGQNSEGASAQIKIHYVTNTKIMVSLIASERGISCTGGLLTWIVGLICAEDGNMTFSFA